jgi:hypothetical protein
MLMASHGKVIPIRPELSEDEKHEIAVLAYQYWLSRDFRDGTPEDDLRRAEREIRRRAASRTRMAERQPPFILPDPA